MGGRLCLAVGRPRRAIINLHPLTHRITAAPYFTRTARNLSQSRIWMIATAAGRSNVKHLKPNLCPAIAGPPPRICMIRHDLLAFQGQTGRFFYRTRRGAPVTQQPLISIPRSGTLVGSRVTRSVNINGTRQVYDRGEETRVVRSRNPCRVVG